MGSQLSRSADLRSSQGCPLVSYVSCGPFRAAENARCLCCAWSPWLQCFSSGKMRRLPGSQAEQRGGGGTRWEGGTTGLKKKKKYNLYTEYTNYNCLHTYIPRD